MEEFTLPGAMAEIDTLKDQVAALQKIIFSALLLLHDRETLPLQSLIAEVKSSAAFFLAAHDTKPPELLDAMLDHLSGIAQVPDSTKQIPPSSTTA